MAIGISERYPPSDHARLFCWVDNFENRSVNAETSAARHWPSVFLWDQTGKKRAGQVNCSLLIVIIPIFMEAT